MKILFRHTRVFTFLLTLLLLGGTASEAWATKVTYHILTLPINPSRYDYHMVSDVTNWRLEAIKVVVDQSSVQLPDQFKSPLVSTYTYYPASADIVKGNSGKALQLFANNTNTKGFIYQIKGVDTADTPTVDAVAEGTSISGDEAEYYVIYEYNEASNTIVKLDGSVNYNIGIKNKGFLAYNRGRNNRPAVMPKKKVDAQLDVLTSEDFVKIENPGSGIGTYWSSGDNKNVQTDVESQFHFLFKFEGQDPYNIILRTAYGRDNTYIEKNDGTNNFVYKWYKEGSLLAVTTNNAYIASDDHRLYTSLWVSGSSNPTNPAREDKPGNFHGQTANAIWGSVALLNNNDRSGYLFMGTRTADNSGNMPTPSDNKYNYLKFDNNNLTFNKLTAADASKNYSTEGIYPIKTVNFHVKTPFGNTVTASIKQSAYVLQSAAIDAKDIPESLRRKYCSFTNFYSDAALTNEITEYSKATDGNIYVKYEVSDAAPFKAIAPSARYTTATWYELTDEGSTQESGRKIKWNDGSPGTYKNNGANGEYVKESEFAFEGDPYELKVLYREGSETTGSNNYVTLSGHDTWDIPNDATDGSFLLRKFNDTGYWNWDTEQASVAVSYGSTASSSVGKDAQTITLNVSGLNGHKYFKITTGGTDVGQIESVTPAVGSVYAETSTPQTVTVKLKANTSVADKTMTITIQEYDDENGSTTSGTASVVTITQGTTPSFAGNEVGYSTTSSTRVKVLQLPKFNFTYNIVDKSGRIAVKASAEQDIYTPLTLASIPSIILSPFLVGEDVTFYLSFNDGSGPGTGTSRTHLSDPRTETPNAPTNIYVKYTTKHLKDKPIKLSEDQEFYVKLNGRYLYCEKVDGNVVIKTNSEYTSDNKYKWKLRNHDPYNMLIDNIGARSDLSVASASEDVTVYNDNGYSTTESRQKGAWVDLASIVNQGALSFTTSRANAQQFIAKSGSQGGVYEVMVANGEDASTNYYNIGCPDNNIVKVYSNAKEGGYSHGDDVLRFVLESENAYTYHLIDKSKKILLEIASKSPDLMLPADYQSPLVASYHYYDIRQFTVTDGIFTLNGGATELTDLSSLDATFTKTSGDYSTSWTSLTATSPDDVDAKAKKLTSIGDFYYRIGETSEYYKVSVTKAAYTDIYVTYDKNDLVTFNSTTSPYLLKFLNPLAEGYKLEDGNDRLTSDEIQAVYPYTNGDGNLNIYGEAMNEEQMNGGASTRPRWVWFFESDNNDPYHVKIHSRSTISFKGINHPTYLQTYAVHFNQDTEKPKRQHVVTGGVLPGVSSVQPSEYMVLGTEGNYRLMTTDPVPADLDGNGDITGDGENQRQVVNSFEQYWKTYNMVKLDVLKIPDSTDGYSTDESTWVVPDDLRDELNSAQPDWHSYDAFANAVRWNGYNDKSDGHTKKVVEKLEHWFQTFEMGNGAFDIISADIPPVLVLLDRHGWEIMRKPLPKASTYPYGEELDALRAYDSPMVKEYKFYSNATKASGCHKYTLRLDDKTNAERDPITVGGEQYTSTSLAALPPRTAKGVISNDAFNDQYVTYTVKDEYEASYRYHLDESTYSEDGSKASRFVVLCNGRYLRDKRGDFSKYHDSYFSKPIYEGSNPTGGNIYDMILSPTKTPVGDVYVDEDKNDFVDDICLWSVMPNLNIDKEMGIKWGTATSGSEPLTENATKLAYKDKTGFDPYNIQLKNAKDSKYFTTHMTSAKLSNGSMVGDYSGTDHYGNAGSIYITREDQFNSYDPNVAKGSEGYDHTNLQISNQTFMAVQDAMGNMQLMPRFDHTKRINIAKYDPFVTTVEDPVDHDKVATIADNESMGAQTVFFVRPQANIYHIIDNDGYEALTYRAGGEWNPIVPDGAKSPLAKDFKFYLTANYDNETKKYTIVESSEIKESIVGALADDEQLYTTNIDIYVRYSYDEDNDEEKILQGRWFTAQLANKDLQASGTVTTTAGETQGTGVSLNAGNSTPAGNENDKPATVDEDDKKWQWKFLVAPMDSSSAYYVAPDPYSVKIYNRNANYSNDTSVEPNPMKIGIKVPNANNGANRFALLSHPNGGHAFAVAQTYASPYEYSYINGAEMTTPSSTAATTKTEGDAIRKEANNDSDYNTKKAALSDGTYYFRIHGEAGTGTPLYRRVYRFKKVTVSGGSVTDEEDCTRTEWENARSEGIKVVLNNDVNHTYTYHVITNGGSDYIVDNPGSLAISATQTKDEASSYNFEPYLPEAAQTTLLNMEDYLYFGSASKNEKETVDTSDDTYQVVPATKLISLEGLYDDVVYVRYSPYDVNTTPYKVPNVRNALNKGIVERADDSKDAAINITGDLPYNIIWYNDNMMSAATVSETTTISDDGSKDLGGGAYVWQFWGNDPYALNIKHKASGKYVDGTGTLSASPKNFMLLKKEDYDYGVFAVTGDKDKMLSFEDDDSNPSTAHNVSLKATPNKFIIFGLSVHNLIYHLVIAKTCPNQSADPLPTDQYVEIPYSEKDKNGVWVTGKSPSDNYKLKIYGTTQRDLTNTNYNLGEIRSWNGTPHTYCHDAGKVTVGDTLEVPSVFKRPNCLYFYYVDGIYSDAARTSPVVALNNKYKGLELTRLPKDDELVGTSVVVNVAYAFQTGLETNAGEGFVTDVNDNYWYTFQTTETTPYLAQYTNAWGLQAMEGRATRYTNDYLWTPVGDVYGFKMYNRYMLKNSGGVSNIMTMNNIAEGKNLYLAVPGTTEIPAGEEGAGSVIPKDYGIFELLDVPNTPGAFRVHPVANTKDNTQLYVYKDASDGNKVKLSTNYTGWTFGLGTDLLKPYIDRKGYVGGLTSTAYTKYKEVLDKVTNGTADYADLRTVQSIVYNDENIVPYSPGYYRLHSQPGIGGMPTVRYASGYLHDIEKTAGHNEAGIPMHLYSREGVSTTFAGDGGLGSGFTISNATRGEIPIDPTEYDPSTIFYFPGAAAESNPTSTISTQGLYVVANNYGDTNDGTTSDENSRKQRAAMAESSGITFTIMDIGGAIVLIHDGAEASVRRYLNYDQDVEVDGKKMIYDLKYYHSANTEESRWCMQPVQKTATAGDGEMPLMIRTNNGGDNYYYTTFYAPFDVLLTDVATPAKTYQAFYCKEWNDNGLHPTMVPATNSYAEGKFIPAGTPVIIRTDDESGSIKVTLPNNSPTSSSITTNIFTGSYLEKKLGNGSDVYTLGLPFISHVEKDADYDTTGDIIAPLPEQATSDLGFYINATPDKESSQTQSLWTRNNRYVLHNKIYYRAPVSSRTRGPEFVPLLFEAAATDVQGVLRPGNVYNLQGRCVATEEMVKDGTWKNNLTPGVYIMSGKKIIVK